MARFTAQVDKVTVKDREIQIVLRAELEDDVLKSVADCTDDRSVIVSILSEQIGMFDPPQAESDVADDEREAG